MHILYKEEDNGFLGLSFNEYLKKPELHIEFKKWNLEEFRKFKKIWEIVKNTLKEAGITEIYSLCDSAKEAKFNKFWGFKDTGVIAYTLDNKFKHVLKLEI